MEKAIPKRWLDISEQLTWIERWNPTILNCGYLNIEKNLR
jgi:hypothetical protein